MAFDGLSLKMTTTKKEEAKNPDNTKKKRPSFVVAEPPKKGDMTPTKLLQTNTILTPKDCT